MALCVSTIQSALAPLGSAAILFVSTGFSAEHAGHDRPRASGRLEDSRAEPIGEAADLESAEAVVTDDWTPPLEMTDGVVAFCGEATSNGPVPLMIPPRRVILHDASSRRYQLQIEPGSTAYCQRHGEFIAHAVRDRRFAFGGGRARYLHDFRSRFGGVNKVDQTGCCTRRPDPIAIGPM